MIVLRVDKDNAGQRLDKFLKRHLKEAQDSFLYKMMRKKNIVLNQKKVAGNELLQEGDEVTLFLAEETYAKFGGKAKTAEQSALLMQYQQAYDTLSGIEIVFENADVLVLNKPPGLLSQKAQAADLSVNEWLIGYLLETKFLSAKTLCTFKPSVCNRLDRNTSGLLVCGKTLAGSRYLSKIVKDKSLQKYYYTLVAGQVMLDTRKNGWLCKNKKTNKVTIYQKEADLPSPLKKDAAYIDTAFRTVETILTKNGEITLLEVQLFTGKTHQIRAQLHALGVPIIGDQKYGTARINAAFYDMNVRNQLLHAYKLVFPKNDDERFAELSERTLTCNVPKLFAQLMTDRPGGRNEVCR